MVEVSKGIAQALWKERLGLTGFTRREGKGDLTRLSRPEDL